MYKKRLTRKKNKAYQKGYRFELRVKKHFEKLGYYVVRKYASKGAEDLIAIKCMEVVADDETSWSDRKTRMTVSEVLLIQCKNLKVERKLTKDAKNNLICLAKQCGATPLLATNRNHKLIIEEVGEP